jgi:hypothetical protein
MAVRPEAIRVVDDGRVSVEVVARTFRRDHFLLDVHVADGVTSDAAPERLQVEVPVDSHRVPDVGDRLRLAADDDALVPV